MSGRHRDHFRLEVEICFCRLDHQKVVLSSNILLRHFVESIFVLVDIAVREDGMFCDLVSFYEPSSNMQVSSCSSICLCLL